LETQGFRNADGKLILSQTSLVVTHGGCWSNVPCLKLIVGRWSSASGRILCSWWAEINPILGEF
jgi:hypothetical protein